jgi:predicted dehydrogenase
MSGNLSEALKIAELAETASIVLTLCHIVRFDPRYAALKQALDSGRVGQVRYMYARRNADQIAAGRVLGKCDPAFWLTVHDIDIMRWITGAEVVSVTAQTIGGGTSVSDGLFADLRFSNGAVGRIENSWAGPPAHNSRNCLFDVQGDAGSIEVDAWLQGALLRCDDDRATAPNTTEICEVNGRLVGAGANMIDDFVQVVSTGRQPAVSMQDGLATIRVADAISRAIVSGGSVTLDA